MDHKEEFEVVTSPDGSSDLSIRLACATVREHYVRTTTAHSTVASDPAEVCSTGLRVYEGAQVLASFVTRYGLGLLLPDKNVKNSITSLPPPPLAPGTGEHHDSFSGVAAEQISVVELGCGCGLVGFTLDHVVANALASPANGKTGEAAAGAVDPVSIVFTDASRDCLALVRRTGELASRPVHDLEAVPPTASSHLTIDSRRSDTTLSTFRLAWSDDGVTALRPHLSPASGARLVVGSDLMYYRVDVDALLHTARLLLQPPPYTLPSPLLPSGAAAGLIVFAHFMRIPDGQRKLAAAARHTHGLCIAAVPLTAFLHQKTVWQRGWNGIELVILCPRSPRTLPAAAEDAAETTGDDPTREEEDVRHLQAMLEQRAGEVDSTALPSHSIDWRCDGAAAQARALSAALQPYPSSILAARGNAGSASAEHDEDDAFLSFFH